MIVSTGTTCSLAIALVCACAVHGQFTFTGFPTAKRYDTHKVTCSYPGATSYSWKYPGGTYNGAVYTFTVNSLHNGVWECDALVNGVKKTGKTNLMIYCDGVYVTSAKTTNPSIGDSIDLNCKVLSPSGDTVQWSFTEPGSNMKTIAAVTRKGRCEYYQPENDIMFTPSTTCATSTSNQFFNLNIKNVSTAHEGYWICYDFGKSGCFSKPVRIAIAKPPTKDPPTLNGFDNPIVGTNHSLTCDAWQRDSRPLTYTWYKDGVQISSGNTSTWRLQPVKKEANGRYKCKVVDKAKNLMAEAENTLTVYYVATWNPAVQQKTEILAMIGRSIRLTLDILAHPLPTSVTWYKAIAIANTTLDQPFNYNTAKLSDTTWVLTILSVQDEDYGLYKANVTNAVGSAIFSFNLTRVRVPDAPSDLKVLVTDTNDLKVTFTSGFNGRAPQTFTLDFSVKDSYPQVIRGIEDPQNTKTVTYTIRQLLAGTTYYIKVKAVNEVGGSKFTETATVKTGGNTVTAGEVAGAVVSVILFVILIVGVVVVVMQRRNTACIAGQGDTRSRDLDPAVTGSVEGNAVHVTNQAFEGEGEPEYVNQPSQERGVVEPEYVNQPRQTRDSDAEVYEDMSTPYNPYAGLDMTARAEEDQPYESLKIANTKT